MQIIPLQAVDNQTVRAKLAGQDCRITVYQKRTGLYCDVHVLDTLVIAGVLCLNMTRIVRDGHRGFAGDLLFQDQAGESDPDSTGLGSRYQLIYMDSTEL